MIIIHTSLVTLKAFQNILERLDFISDAKRVGDSYKTKLTFCFGVHFVPIWWDFGRHSLSVEIITQVTIRI